MAKYNSDCKNEYAMQLMGECFRNSLKYYKKSVFDYDYFYPVFSMADTKEIAGTAQSETGGAGNGNHGAASARKDDQCDSEMAQDGEENLHRIFESL